MHPFFEALHHHLKVSIDVVRLPLFLSSRLGVAMFHDGDTNRFPDLEFAVGRI